jgi:ABC-type bacteriocin/lantibiotic exporter with double-glycine peptidase domain
MAARNRGIRLETSSFKQRRAMCGPACLKIVLAYFGKRASEKLIASACRSSPLSGTTGTNLVRGAGRFGFDAELVDHSNFRMMKKWLRRGVPVIVDWMSTTGSGPRRTARACGHYSVVCGLDERHIILQDPSIGRRRRLARKHFRDVWFDFRRVFPRAKEDLIIRRLIIVVPRERSRGGSRKSDRPVLPRE